MTTEYVELEGTAYFGFGANDSSGADDADSTPTFDVREAGATASDAPTHNGNCTLLSNAGYELGAYEVAVPCTAANGFAADTSYLVYVSATVNGTVYSSYVGSIKTSPLTTAKDLGQMLKTTVSSVNSQTDFVLADGAGDDDAYNQCVIMFEDADGDVSIRFVNDYVGSTNNVLINTGPSFTVAATDTVRIFANPTPGMIGANGASLTALASATNLSTVDTVVDSLTTDLATLTTNVATVDTVVDAIQLKTDALTFTIANELDVNVQSMNGTTLLGSGTGGDLWRGS